MELHELFIEFRTKIEKIKKEQDSSEKIKIDLNDDQFYKLEEIKEIDLSSNTKDLFFSFNRGINSSSPAEQLPSKKYWFVYLEKAGEGAAALVYFTSFFLRSAERIDQDKFIVLQYVKNLESLKDFLKEETGWEFEEDSDEIEADFREAEERFFKLQEPLF